MLSPPQQAPCEQHSLVCVCDVVPLDPWSDSAMFVHWNYQRPCSIPHNTLLMRLLKCRFPWGPLRCTKCCVVLFVVLSVEEKKTKWW